MTGETRKPAPPALRPAVLRVPLCLCPGCRVPLTIDEKWFCATCQFDVGRGCGCGFVPEWNR